MIRNKIVEQYNSIIKSVLNQANVVYLESELSSLIRNFTRKTEKLLIINKDNVSIEASNFDFVFIKYSNIKDIDELKEIISKQDYSEKLVITIIVNSMQEKYALDDNEFRISIRKDIKNTIKDSKARKNFLASSINCRFCNQNNKDKFIVNIGNRIDCLQNNMDNVAKGYIFSADLFDLVNIYNLVGDALFNCNVRYGIKDSSNVDKEITNTLQNEPDKFWFYNNGITIVIKDDDFDLRRQNILELSGKKLISVVNGAQTITASAKFYYKQGEQGTKVSPKVLLRLINFNEKSTENDEVNKVTISLNRQKNINEEDIVYTYSFVSAINEIMLECNDSDKCFDLIKRGGESYYKHSYGIKEFAQIVKCYLGQAPGNARSNPAVLIEDVFDKDSEEYRFKDESIFRDIKNINDFIKYYSPVNFAFDLLDLYDKTVKSKIDAKDEQKNAIYNYGKWYFMALCVYLLNDKDSDDFTEFNYKIDSNVNVENTINMFVSMIKSSIDENEKLDSNNFKTNELYNKIRELSTVNEFEIELKKIFVN